MSRLLRRCLLPLLLLAALPTSAEDTAMLDAVRAFLTAEAAPLGDEVSVTLYPPAAHFPACQQPTPFLRDTSRAPLGRLSVGVRCSGEDRRTRYLQAEVSVIGRYPVTAHAIEAGTRLTRDDLEERRGSSTGCPGGHCEPSRRSSARRRAARWRRDGRSSLIRCVRHGWWNAAPA